MYILNLLRRTVKVLIAQFVLWICGRLLFGKEWKDIKKVNGTDA